MHGNPPKAIYQTPLGISERLVILLDKTIPYIPVVMRRDSGHSLPVCPLPEGFQYQKYQPGFEKDWARIEASVDEFECEMDALIHFQKSFMPYSTELPRRCFFVATAEGKRIGTATAWWDYVGQRRYPLIHWVAVKPDFQGKGLGKALIAEVLRLMTTIDGDGIFYLRTSTYSHKAIQLYERVGFYLVKEKEVFGRPNAQYEEAVALLQTLRENMHP